MYNGSKYGIGLSPLEKTAYATPGLGTYRPELREQDMLFERARNPQAYESILKNYYHKLAEKINGIIQYDPFNNSEEASTLEKNIADYHKDPLDRKHLDPRTHRALPLGPEEALIIDIGLNPTGLKINSLGKIDRIRLQ